MEIVDIIKQFIRQKTLKYPLDRYNGYNIHVSDQTRGLSSLLKKLRNSSCTFPLWIDHIYQSAQVYGIYKFFLEILICGEFYVFHIFDHSGNFFTLVFGKQRHFGAHSGGITDLFEFGL